MSTLSITKSYKAGQPLLESDLDNIRNGIQDFVNGAQIGTDNIASGGISTANLGDLSVTTAKLANNSVTSTKLKSSASVDADRSVTTDHIKDAAVTSVKIADGAVTTAKIAASAVNTTAIADANVTRAKMAPLNYIESSAVNATFAPGVGVESTVTSATITAGGTRPILIFMKADSSNAASPSYLQRGVSGTPAYLIYRDSTLVAANSMGNGGFASGFIPLGAQVVVDSPAAGTYTYSLVVRNNGGSVSEAFSQLKLALLEL